MNKTNIFILVLLLICLSSISCVAAIDVNDTIISADDSQTIVMDSPGSYSELQDLINSGNDTISLDKDYVYDGNLSQVLVSNPITINGNGHTIDGNNMARHFYINANNVVLNNINFINGNAASNYGGSIYWNGTNGTLSDSTFSNNYAAYGGAIRINNVDCTVINSTFDNNSASYGGAIIVYGQNFSIISSVFENNAASAYGGAVYVYNRGATVLSSEFRNNSAFGGGAFYVNRNDFLISDSTFEGNGNSWRGGSIYCTASNATLKNSNFSNDRASYGGSIYSLTNNLIMDSVSIVNSSAAQGGAVYIEGNNTKITGSDFIGNEATDFGGAIYWKGYGASISDSNILNNLADYGAGILMIRPDSNVENNNFISNNATYVGGGLLYNPVGINLNGNDFDNNHPDESEEMVYTIIGFPYDVPMSNGYNGYCMNRTAMPPMMDDMFVDYNNTGSLVDEKGVKIWDKVKNYFYNNYLEMDKNEFNLTLISILKDSSIYSNSTYVPDRGAMKVINETTIARYNFKYVSPISDLRLQSLFLVEVEFLHPNMTVEKIANNKTVKLGEISSFTIIVNNTGIFNLTNVKVSENIPEGLNYLAYEGENWIKDGDVFKYNKTLLPEEAATFTIYFNTTNNGTFTNVVVASSNETENKTANNTTTVLKPDLVVQKITLTPEVVLGSLVSFDILVENVGEVELGDVRIVEESYPGLTYHSWKEDDLWTYGVIDSKHTWTLNRKLLLNETLTIRVFFNTTETGNFTNTAVVSSNETGNKTVNNTTTVLKPDLVVQKITLTPEVVLGSLVSFDILVENVGEVELSDVRIVEESYPGLTYHSWKEDDLWTYGVIDSKHTWTLNQKLVPNEILAIKVFFNTTVAGNFTNTAVVSSNETGNKTVNNTTTVLKPDLAVQKITLTPVVSLGSLVSFDILVENVGEVELSDVRIVEESYPGLTYHSWKEDDLWTYGVIDSKHTWTLNQKLVPNEILAIKVFFNTTEAGNFTNTAVVSSNETGNETVNNTTEVLKGDIFIEKIALNKEVTVNNIVTFEIFVKNIGQIDLNDVRVSDIPDEGLTYVGYHETALWNYDEGVWKYNGVLAPGASSFIYAYFNATKLGNLTNMAVVSSYETENKSDNDTVEVFKPHISIRKVALERTVGLGSEVTFEIIVHNDGEVELNNVTVTDIVPEGLIFSSQNSNGLWTYSNGVWTLNDVLKVNEYVSFYVTFIANRTGNLTNTVVVKSNETENVTNNTNITVLEGNLTVQKITLTPYVVIGERIGFEIVVQNTGLIDLNDVYIIEESYEGLTYDGYDNIDDWTYLNGKWILNHVLKPNQFTGLFVYFIANATGNYTNVVCAGANETNKSYANNTTEVFNSSEEEPTSNETEIKSMDLIKTALDKTIVLGNQAIFQIVIHNTGNVKLENITISEEFYSGLVYDTFVDNTGMFKKNDDLSWTVQVLYPGEFLGFNVYFNTTDAGNFTNIVSDGNKTSNDTVVVLKPSYVIEKIALNKTLALGQIAVFEIVVYNDGEIGLDNITISEVLHEGLDYIRFVDYAGSWTFGDNLTWSLNNILHPGEYSGFFVYFTVTRVGNLTNVVSSGNKTANDTVEVKQYSYELEKTAIEKLVKLGNQAVFEIIVHNTGEIPLDNVAVSEIFFDGLIYDHYLDNTGKWTFDSLTWRLDDTLHPGEYSGFFVVFNTTSAGEFINIVSYENKTANDTVEVVKPEYKIEKIALNKSVLVGDEVVFEIVVHNTGRVALDNVAVVESSFDGLDYLGYVDAAGRWINEGFSWTLSDSLAPGEYIGFFVRFNTTNPGEFINTIVSGNLTANDTVEVVKPEYKIEKIALNKSVLVGDEVVFEIVVHNTGRVALDNVAVVESSFDGLDYLGYVDATGRWINEGFSWTLSDSLAPGEYIGFFVRFNTTNPGVFSNVIVSGNLTANDSVVVNIAKYTIEKIALNRSVFVGDEVVFEIVVRNTGSVALDNVTVVESSFDGLEYLGYVDASGKWINHGLSWTFGDSLAPGEYAGFRVIFNTTGVGNLTNVIVSGNLTANDTVEVLNKTVPDENKTTPGENTTIPDGSDVKRVNISSTTGNPILLVLLILLNLVILRRRK